MDNDVGRVQVIPGQWVVRETKFKSSFARAGVQSSALALKKGEIPMVDCAIFAELEQNQRKFMNG